MHALVAVAILAATVAATELAATSVHRWLMHGPGWRLHRSHHRGDGRRWQANDLYALPFIAAALALFAWGGGPAAPAWWIGAGITVYGALYAWVHDGLAHRRWPAGRVPARGWRARRVAAHRLHHATTTRDGAVAFGFLWTRSPRVLARELRARRAFRRAAADLAADRDAGDPDVRAS